MPDRLPSIAEIAALTARLRALSAAGRDADPGEVERFLANKHALLDRITDHDAGPGAAREDHPDRDPYDGYRTYTPDTAAEQLIAAGVAPDAAHAAVERYLEALSTARGWEPAQGWEIDDDDVAAMLSRHTSGAGRPDPHSRSRPALDSTALGEEDDQRAQLNRRRGDDGIDSDSAGWADEDAAADGVPW